MLMPGSRMYIYIYIYFILQGKITFLGSRPRNRQVLQRRMYRHEIEQWMQEAAAVDKRL